MFESVITKYNGTDATIEILTIVLISMVLGWLARWVYEQIMYDDVYGIEDGSEWYSSGDVISEGVVGEEVVEPVAEATKEDVVRAEQFSIPQSIIMPYKQDDLKIIEGIGPKIEQLLHEGGIVTWQELANTEAGQIRDLLRAAGERYRIHDPTTWPEQAMLAAGHQWDELEEFQDSLSGGKDLTKIYGNKE